MFTKYFPNEEYEVRWDRVRAEIKRRGYDVAVVWGRTAGTYNRSADIVYLSNYYSQTSTGEFDTPVWKARSFSALIFQGDELPELHIDEPVVRPELLASQSPAFVGTRDDGFLDVVMSVADGLDRRKIEGRVALVGSDFLPVKHARRIEAATPGIEWCEEDNLVESVRRIKGPREIECYREGGAVATRSMNTFMENFLVGKSEAEAAALATAEVIRAGGATQRVAIAHGPSVHYHTTNPLYGHSLEVPEPGDMFHVWVYGPLYEGYWYDPGRTSVVGCKPSADQKESVEHGVRITDAVIAAIKPGVKVADIGRLGDKLVGEVSPHRGSLGEAWPIHGHGIGQFWEHPWISDKLVTEDEIFEENMTLGIEIFFENETGNVGFEQNIIIGADANELVTKSPMLWW